tara:strand:+ start:9 stop:593 length:585 start_codon:yes stop_codon:yes gene_type:complete
MPRTKKFNEEVIIEEAMHLFWKEGFHSTSIQDLVEHLGINRASLYDTYGDKEGLFKKCYDYYKTIMQVKIDDIFINSKDDKTGFKNLFKFIIDDICLGAEHKGCLISNSYSELLPNCDKTIYNTLNKTREFLTNILKDKLLLAKKNKSLKKGVDINKTSVSMYSSIVGVAIISKMNVHRDILKISLDPYIKIFS